MEMLSFLNQPENSLIQEQFAEHTFVRDLIQASAKNKIRIDISHSEKDIFGYDLIISRENDNKIFYLQLKARSGKKSKQWRVHKSLLKRETGRVILILLSPDKNDENKIGVSYKMFHSKNRDGALSRKPKNDKLDNRCLVRENDFIPINDLAEIFS